MTMVGEWHRASGERLQAHELQIANLTAQGLTYDGATEGGAVDRDSYISIDADFLTELLLGQIVGWTSHPSGIKLKNLRIVGPIYLTSASVRKEQVDEAVLPLTCTNIFFTDTIYCARVRAGSFYFDRCRMVGLQARSARFSGPLVLMDCEFGAHNESFSNAKDTNSSYQFDKRTQYGDDHKFGLIDLTSANIDGDFHAARLRMEYTSDDREKWVDALADITIQAENAKINGCVDISARALENSDLIQKNDIENVIFPYIHGNFDNCEVFGDFCAAGAFFAGRGSGAEPGTLGMRQCLDLRGCNIRGDLQLDHVCATGQIRIEDAIIGQDISLGGAQIVNLGADVEDGLTGTHYRPCGVVVEASRVFVKGSVELVDRSRADECLLDARRQLDGKDRDPRLLAIGQLRFTGSEVGGDFDATGATVCATGVETEGVAFDMRGMTLGGTLYFDARKDVGPGLFIGLINLIHVRVRGSVIFAGSWFRAATGQMMGPERIHKVAPEFDWPKDLNSGGSRSSITRILRKQTKSYWIRFTTVFIEPRRSQPEQTEIWRSVRRDLKGYGSFSEFVSGRTRRAARHR